MTINRRLWRTTAFGEIFPEFPCPACGGVLQRDANTTHERMPQYVRDSLEYVDIEDASSRFSAFLVCANGVCGEVIAVSGNCSFQYDYDEEGKTITITLFHPVAMTPPPEPIDIGENVPQAIIDILKSAFFLYWNNHGACANKIRIAVERMLDEQDIPRTKNGGGYMALAQRIQLFADSYGDEGFAKYLVALKWLGNAGSHDGEVHRDTILDAFEIVEHVLDVLYPPTERDKSHLPTLRDEIIESKGMG